MTAEAEEPKSPRFALLRRLFAYALYGLAGLCCALTLVSFGGAWHWRFDLLSHFRVQHLFLTLGWTTLFAAWRRWSPMALCGVCALCNIWVVAPYYLNPTPLASGTRLRVVLSNIFERNTEAGRVLQMIETNQPELLVLQEVTPRWEADLAPLRRIYPHVALNAKEDYFRCGIWSKFPIRRTQILSLGWEKRSTLVVELDIQGRAVTVLTTHPFPPMGARGTALRNKQLYAVAEYIGTRSGARLWIGDCNVTPWSHVFRRVLRDARLRDSAKGHGVFPSWSAQNPWLRVPIDHILHSPEFRVADRAVLPPVGSDHLPIRADLILTP